MSKYINLSDVFIDCFKQYIGKEEEGLLHEDGFVTKKLKKFLGKKEFEKWDSLEDTAWKEAWREFDDKIRD